MSQCLWCDLGQHPFPAGQSGSTTLAVRNQVQNQWGGTQPHDVTKDVCAACAKDYGYRNLTVAEKTQAELDREAEIVRDNVGGMPAPAARRRRFALKSTEPDDRDAVE